MASVAYPAISKADEYWKIQNAIDRIRNDYGVEVSVDLKRKTLRKFGENSAVGTSKTTIENLPAGELHETLLTSNGITSVSSSSGSDTMNLTLVEGHTYSSGDLTFSIDTNTRALMGQTDVTLGTALRDGTRARIDAPANGTIYFHEGGATTGGVPNDLTTVHLIIPAGDTQTQKCATAISSTDYWIMTGAGCGLLTKANAWAEARIEIKLASASADSFYPITEWVPCPDAGGKQPFLEAEDPYLIVPSNHDVRMVAKADSSGRRLSGAMDGFLAKVVT